MFSKKSLLCKCRLPVFSSQVQRVRPKLEAKCHAAEAHLWLRQGSAGLGLDFLRRGLSGAPVGLGAGAACREPDLQEIRAAGPRGMGIWVGLGTAVALACPHRSP